LNPPPPPLAASWRASTEATRRPHTLTALAATWNVGEGRPDAGALAVGGGAGRKGVGLVLVGLQEVEMTANGVAREALLGMRVCGGGGGGRGWGGGEGVHWILS